MTKKEYRHQYWLKNKEKIKLKRQTPEYKANQRKSYVKNIEKIAAYRKKYDATHKEQRKARDAKNFDNRKDKRLQYYYGISLSEYNALIAAQENCCVICKVKFNSDGYKSRPHLDHNHSTGKIRQILCNNCNSLIGYAQENVEVLTSAIDYLNKHRSLN